MRPTIRIKYPDNPRDKGTKELKTKSENTNSDYNNYLERLTKLIPGEAITLYLTARTLNLGEYEKFLPFVGLLVVIIVRTLGSRIDISEEGLADGPKYDIEWPLVIISIVSFAIWIYAIGGTILGFGKDVPNGVWGLTVMLWTFMVPYFYKAKPSV